LEAGFFTSLKEKDVNLHRVGKQPLLRKAVKQSNHDGANVPLSLKDHAEQPLYMLVALWCLQQDDWLDRQQISAAFSITERRASFLISYIQRHAERINCLTRKVKKAPTGRYRQQLKVQHVRLEDIDPKTAAVRQSKFKTSLYAERQENWRYILSRQASDVK